MIENNNPSGKISNIQKFCVHDGYGIRTVVFFLGCPLRCQWCQNPETIHLNVDLMVIDELCVACGDCERGCPQKAIYQKSNGKFGVERTLCTRCMECVKVCAFDARKPSGTEYTSDGLLAEVLKDKVFYDNSKGGITLSGGEPLLQIEFAEDFLRKCKGAGLHIALETAGYVPWQSFERILDYTDLFLYDLKVWNPLLHKNVIGQNNALILSNLEKLSTLNKEIIIRIPLIPNINDGEEFEKIIDKVVTLNSIKVVHILPFHQLGSSKYEQLDMVNQSAQWDENSDENIMKCKKYAVDAGFQVSVGGSGI